MVVTELHIYPVKGLRGIRVTKAKLTERGFERDRRWMLVDNDGLFISQRTHPKLARFSTKFSEEGDLIINYDTESIVLTSRDVTEVVIEVSMWDKCFMGHLLSDTINNWWKMNLDSDVRMVYMTDDDIRIKEYGDKDTQLSYADGYPYLIIGTESLAYLNSKLDTSVPMNRFRPNIVVKTTTPHIEDDWSELSIGDQLLNIVKPCARCTVVTVDQLSGKKGIEPLRTLATYRKVGNKVNFGVNAVAITGGIISIGDRVSSTT